MTTGRIDQVSILNTYKIRYRCFTFTFDEQHWRKPLSIIGIHVCIRISSCVVSCSFLCFFFISDLRENWDYSLSQVKTHTFHCLSEHFHPTFTQDTTKSTKKQRLSYIEVLA